MDTDLLLTSLDQSWSSLSVKLSVGIHSSIDANFDFVVSDRDRCEMCSISASSHECILFVSIGYGRNINESLILPVSGSM